MKKKTTEENILQLEKQVDYVVSVPRRFVNLLMKAKSTVIGLFPDKENLINLVFSRCAIMVILSEKKKMFNLKEKILSIQEFPQKNNLMTLLGNMNISNPKILNIQHIHLFKILAQELISKKKDSTEFWNPVCKTISENLSLPTEIDSRDLDLNSSKSLLKKQEVSSQFLTMTSIKVQNKNCQKISYQLCKYIVANPWEKEDTQLKAMKIKILPTDKQKEILNKWFNTSNYVYNKTVEEVRKDNKAGFISLRDKLVTNETKKKNTEYIKFDKEIEEIRNIKKFLEKELKNKSIDECKKEENEKKIEKLQELIKQKNVEKRNMAKSLKSEKNQEINSWELETPKEIRAAAVKSYIDARKSAITNLIRGNIKKFNISYRKRKDNNCISIQKNLLSVIDLDDPNVVKNAKIQKTVLSKCSKERGKNEKFKIKIAPDILEENMLFKVGKKSEKDLKKYKLEIIKDCKITRFNNMYYVIVPVEIEEKTPEIQEFKNLRYCGVDPGIRTFLTTFSPNEVTEYNFNNSIIEKIDNKIKTLKNVKYKNIRKKLSCGVEKKKIIKKIAISKLERNKANYIDELHWSSIKNLLENNDVIFYGDIKSHDIVKNKKNQSFINTPINNLKFYKFKERLLYKAKINNKIVYPINESFTTKTCTNCGCLNDVGASKIYECNNCKIIIGRDHNAARNILIKGLSEKIQIF